MSGGYDGKIAGLYDLEETLGKGHYAVVKLARHVFTGEKVAVKVIDKLRLDEISRAHLFQEVRCMKLVQHPNVVRLYEVIDTQTKLYLILEWADGGDMYDYIMKHDTGLDELAARKYFRQIVHAISFCHRLHVVHRDLKPENVVFFEKLGMVKLTDFGFSNKFCPGQMLDTSCGSLAYSAPEILLGDSYDAPAVDIWSLGVILYMLVVGKAPFQEMNDSETLTRIMDCKYTIPEHVSQPCKDLIAKMLIRDPQRRATLEDIDEDPWLMSDSPEVHIADVLPLVSKQHLTEEDHAHIIHKMAAGSIASVEEILDALDRNEYNHVTATYFLLAERKLRNQRLNQAHLTHKNTCNGRIPSNLLEENSVLCATSDLDLKLPIPQSKDDSSNTNFLHNKFSEGRMGNRLRTFSILEEEEEEEDIEVEDLPEEELGVEKILIEEGEGELRGQRSRSGSRSGSRSESRSGSRRGSRASSTSSLKDKCLRDMKLDLSLLHRLELVRRGSGSLQGSTATSPSIEELLVPQPPFPQSSNIGLGLGRVAPTGKTCSASSSPVTTPPTSLVQVSNGSVRSLSPTTAATSASHPPLPPPSTNKLTPQSSVSSSPTSQNSSPSSPLPHLPSSPKTQGSFFSPKFKTLPSPNRRLHSVRSSPQLILNEIFEEGESDGEGVGGTTENSSTKPIVLPPPHTSSASPSDLRRRGRMARSRTLSGSSSDASEDDSSIEARKWRKRVIAHRQFSKEEEIGDGLMEEEDEELSIEPFSDIPQLTLSPAPSSPLLHGESPGRDDFGGMTSKGGLCRPLSATVDESSSFSTENMLDIDTTLRESRSLNCIVRASDEGGESVPLVDQASSSFDESFVVGISRDNVTTIYIENKPVNTTAGTDQNDSELDERVIIHVSDVVTKQPNGSLRTSPVSEDVIRDSNQCFTLPVSSRAYDPTVSVQDVLLSELDNTDSCSNRYARQHRYMKSHDKKSPLCWSSSKLLQNKSSNTLDSSKCSLSCLSTSTTDILAGGGVSTPSSRWPFSFLSRPVSSGPVLSQPPSLSNALSKSASHIEALKTGNMKSHKLRSSATNGSLTPGRAGYLIDINQNAGGRKNRVDKTGLPIHGTSKCCTVS